MMSVRLASVGVALSVLAAICHAAVLQGDVDFKIKDGQQHNYVFGQRVPGDRLLYSETIRLKSKLWRVNEVDLLYPKPGQPQLGTISSVEITDLRKDGTGGYATIKSGGPTVGYVSLHLETRRNHGLDFDVKVYGK